MAVKVTLTDGIGWRTVFNKVREKTINGSLLHTLKSTKKIKRRTRALNIKLKRNASQISYRQYVKTKTIILRNITDNEDTDDNVGTYRVGIQSTRENSPVRCSKQSKARIASPNSDTANGTDCASLPRKQNKQTRKKDIIESHSSAKLAKRNLEESTNEPRIANVDNEITPVKSLTKVKRNLTSLLENFQDDTNIIGESMEIDESNGEDNYESQRNAEPQDSLQLENCQNDEIAHENTEFVSDKMSVNSDAESNDKPMIDRVKAVEVEMEVEQEEQQSMVEEALTKRSQLVITSTEIVRSKYTIVRDEGETTDPEDTSHDECSDINTSPSSRGNELLTDQEASPAKKLSAEDKRVDQIKRINLVSSNISDSRQSQDDRVDANKYVVSPDIDSDSSRGNTFLADQQASPAKKLSSENKRVDQIKRFNLVSSNSSDSRESQDDRVDANKYVASPDIDSGSSRRNTFLTDQQASPTKKLSSENKRVDQRKGINLVLFNSSDSEENQTSKEDRVDANKHDPSSDSNCRIDDAEETAQPSCSEIISDPTNYYESTVDPDDTNHDPTNSDESIADPDDTNHDPTNSDESTADPDDTNRDPTNSDESTADPDDTNHDPTNSDESTADPDDTNHDHTNSDESTSDPDDTIHHPITSSSSISDTATLLNTVMNKSIISQIREQEKFYSSTPLNKIVESSSKESNNNSGGEEEEQDGGNYLRPMELCEFVERERLVPTEELSTITAKDFKEFELENGDEEIWLMEIPKSIITDGDELCGKTMAFENEKMTINGTTYRTTCRDEKSVTCILRSRKKKTQFKTVKMEAVGCIVVRQEFSDKKVLPVPVQCAQQCESVVPFPKNLKSRNPLLGMNSPNDMDHFEHVEHRSSAKDIHEIFQSKKKVKSKGVEPLYFT